MSECLMLKQKYQLYWPNEERRDLPQALHDFGQDIENLREIG